MPRGETIYNGKNDEIEETPVVRKEEIEGHDRRKDRQTDRRKDRRTGNPKLTEEENSMTARAMAVEFDHMYIGCSESKASLGKDIEVQHLKDLLLLHLDLIQQQAEQLVAKDKLIKRLRDENENLKSKLDRIDRRVSLSLGKKQPATGESASVEPKNEADSEDVQLDVHLTKRIGSPSSKADSPVSKNASFCKSPSSKPVSPASKSVSPPSKAGSPGSKPGSPAGKPLSPGSKPLSLGSKPGSPTSKPGSPTSKPGSPTSKPISPACKTVSPASKPISPTSKPMSPASKPASPANKPGSPIIKPGSPASKPGSPASKPGSPVSKPGSPVSNTRSPPSKPGPSANKSGSPVNRSSPSANKSVSPTVKVMPPSKSPSNKLNSSNKTDLSNIKPLSLITSLPSKDSPVSPSSKTGLLVVSKTSLPSTLKPSSPQPKIIVVQDTEELPSIEEETTCSIESTNNSAPATRGGKKPLAKQASPKTPLRERRQRSTSQSQVSENDTDASTKDFPKSSSLSEKERSRIKRKSESESDTSTPKRIRTDRDSRSSHSKDNDLTDHNLRSRDKSKDILKGSGKSDELPASLAEVPAKPSPRAAALEAKKLRQKLQLKEQSIRGETYGQTRGKTPIGASVRAEGILNTTVSYHLPYGVLRYDPNPEEECLQAQVEIPRWGTRILTSLYVMEGTENLEDEIFIKRHAKPEQDEKRRKRWDLQRMREQRHYERLRERYESRQTSSEPTSSSHGSLWPHPESAVYLHIEDTLPVCAFGQPLARIPPQEFAIPWLIGQCAEGVSTRRRKR